MVIELTKANFEKEVMTSDVPVVVDFWASWCGPCRMVSPIIDSLAEEYGDKIKVCKVNVDAESALASEFAVVSIPTVLIIKDGKTAERSVGAKSFDDFCDMIDAHL
ncbi:MAG: thioredoxin [Clostridia bacterium]|nr:thioredoxin [Clostridia bacterium]MBQ8637512.1 thioredoxin [Clostridia bacterium]